MLHDVRRRRIGIPGAPVEIALLEWEGPGPLALLHHATGFCAACWAPVAEGLRRSYRVAAVDARGHGESSRPRGPEAYHWRHFGSDLAAVAEALTRDDGGGRVALALGHSLGGAATLIAAAARPDLFERLVLLDPVLLPPAAYDAREARRSSGNPMAEGARRRREVWDSRDEARASWRGKSLFAGWDPRALDLYVAEGMRDRADGRVELKCAGEVEATVFESAWTFDPWSIAAQVRAPTRILWARRGTFARELYEQYAARMPDGRVEDAPTDHLIPMIDPGFVVRAVGA